MINEYDVKLTPYNISYQVSENNWDNYSEIATEIIQLNDEQETKITIINDKSLELNFNLSKVSNMFINLINNNSHSNLQNQKVKEEEDEEYKKQFMSLKKQFDYFAQSMYSTEILPPEIKKIITKIKFNNELNIKKLELLYNFFIQKKKISLQENYFIFNDAIDDIKRIKLLLFNSKLLKLVKEKIEIKQSYLSNVVKNMIEENQNQDFILEDKLDDKKKCKVYNKVMDSLNKLELDLSQLKLLMLDMILIKNNSFVFKNDRIGEFFLRRLYHIKTRTIQLFYFKETWCLPIQKIKELLEFNERIKISAQILQELCKYVKGIITLDDRDIEVLLANPEIFPYSKRIYYINNKIINLFEQYYKITKLLYVKPDIVCVLNQINHKFKKDLESIIVLQNKYNTIELKEKINKIALNEQIYNESISELGTINEELFFLENLISDFLYSQDSLDKVSQKNKILQLLQSLQHKIDVENTVNISNLSEKQATEIINTRKHLQYNLNCIKDNISLDLQV